MKCHLSQLGGELEEPSNGSPHLCAPSAGKTVMSSGQAASSLGPLVWTWSVAPMERCDQPTPVMSWKTIHPGAEVLCHHSCRLSLRLMGAALRWPSLFVVLLRFQNGIMERL